MWSQVESPLTRKDCSIRRSWLWPNRHISALCAEALLKTAQLFSVPLQFNKGVAVFIANCVVDVVVVAEVVAGGAVVVVVVCRRLVVAVVCDEVTAVVVSSTAELSLQEFQQKTKNR